jgi:2'-5' RNA ligase
MRWTTPEHWHITLRFLGSVDLDEAADAFRAVEVGAPGEVVAELGPATGRFGRRVLHVPVEGLERLATAAVAATEHVGRPPEDRPFSGHITLARARERRGVDMRPHVGVSMSASWPVRELTLVRSQLGRPAAQYEVVERLTVGRAARAGDA